MRDGAEKLNVLDRIGAARGTRKTTAAPPRRSTPAHTATIAATLARRPAMPLLPGEPGNTGKTWKANNRPLCPARRASAEMCAKVPLHGTAGASANATVQRGARGGSPSPTRAVLARAKLVGRRRSRRAVALRWRFGLRRAIRRFRGDV